MDLPTKPDATPEIRRPLVELWEGIKNWFQDLLDLRDGMDREGTVIAIKSGKRMQGANAWMLICSIMIASLGLDLNSAAVIIGAMLISPLMSPILGVGLGVATNDREALFLALRHFGISIIIALVTSVFYFYVTPLGTLTDEIRARTEPTFLDGLVAIFGGLAGIISITRKDKSNAIPGVAIATALMPPLCVTGYGIANGNWSVALNSFYLFFLNSFFIALTSYLIIRLLKFPYRTHPNEQEGRRARLAVAVFSLLIIIPGTMILRNVIRDVQYQQSVKTFVDNHFGTDCLDFQVFPIKADSNLLVVELMNREVSDSATLRYNQIMQDSYKLDQTYLRPIPDYGIQLKELDRMALQMNQLNTVTRQLDDLKQRQLEEERQDSLQQVLLQQAQQMDSTQFSRLSAMIHQADQFAMIDTLVFGEMQVTDWENPVTTVPQFFVHWSNGPGPRTKKRQEESLRSFIKNYVENFSVELDTFVVHSYW